MDSELSQSAMPVIPSDIWTHVARFIPIQDLSDMLAVNRAFFHLAMDAKYRGIMFYRFHDVDAALKRMRRLRDPNIAHRVRNLYIHLDSRDRNDSGVLQASWTLSAPALAEVMKVMTDTVACFTNVWNFTFQWSPMPSEEHLGPFFTEVWKTFSTSLQSLSLSNIPLETLPSLLSTTQVLPALRLFRVYLHYPHEVSMTTPNKSHIHSTVAGDLLARFVNKTTLTLRDFTVASWPHADVLFQLFRQLGCIPNLERLSMFATRYESFDGIFDIIEFIRTHAVTLRHLEWECPLSSQEPVVVNCLVENEFDGLFANLLTLRLSVPLCPDGFSRVMRCIMRSAGTLTSLGLPQHDLTYDEVETLVCIFAPRHIEPLLQTLDLQVMYLSPELMLLFTQKLPRLERLRLQFRHLRAQDGVAEIDPTNKEEELVLARKFAAAMRKIDFRRDLSLHDIRIKNSRLFDNMTEVKIMDLVAECIPSVETYGDIGKNDPFWRMGQPEGILDAL